jgi:O-antigen ligase
MATIYWSRLALAVVAAAISTVVAVVQGVGEPGDYSRFLNGVTIALLVYLVTYWIIYKTYFKNKIEKQTKLMTQGIGIYFIAWALFWILFYTIVRGPPPVA